MATPEQLATLAGLTQDQRDALASLATNLGLGAQGQAARNAAQPHVKLIPCPNYVIGKDFDIWLTHFVDCVRAAYNVTATDARLGGYCTQWLSTKLEPGPTRAVFDNLPTTVLTGNWAGQKAALEQAFTDDKDRLDFLASTDAFQRTPGMSLRTYKDSLLMKMNKYQGALKAVQTEWDRTASQRFREGLKNPVLKAHLMMNCPDSSGIEEAFKVATTWENTLSQLNKDSNQADGANAVLSALMGFPTGNTSTVDSVVPKMAALGMGAMERPIGERMTAMETKIKQNELHIAEVRDGITNIRSEFQEMKNDIKSGFHDLRRDLGIRSNQAAANTQMYTPAYTPPAHNTQGYAPSPQQQQGHKPAPQQAPSQPYRPPQHQNNQRTNFHPRPSPAINHGVPRTVAGLTQGSTYVNNNLMKRPSAPQNNQPPAMAGLSHQNPPVIGAMEGTAADGASSAAPAPETGADDTSWIYESNPMAFGNVGNGWQSFPEEARNENYNKQPEGLLQFAPQEGHSDFHNPATAPGGLPLGQ